VADGHEFPAVKRLEDSKNAFYPLLLHLAPSLGVIPLEFCRDLSRHITSFSAIVWRCFRDPIYLATYTTPDFDGQTDGRADRHWATEYTALAKRRADK